MKNMLLSKIIMLLSFTAIFITCAKYKENPVGSEFFQRDDMGDEKSCMIYASPSDTFFHYSNVKTGGSSFLNIGAVQNHDIQAKSLIKFWTNSDTIKIDSASLTLYIHKFYGQNNGMFSCSIYQIAKQWYEDSLSINNYDDELQGEFIKDFTVFFNDTVKNISITLPSTLIQSWIDSTTIDDNHGLLFISNNSQFITEFYSSESDSNRPALQIYTPADTDSTYPGFIISPSEDIFIADGEFAADSDYLYLCNGVATRTLLFFDVSVIPEQATINKAYLNIYSDTTSAFPDWQDTYMISIFKTIDKTWPIPDVPLDSSAYTTISLNSDSASGDITLSVQQWTSKMEENYGLLLKGQYEYRNLDYRKIYNSKADTSKKPSLKIFYSIPPESGM